MWNLSEIAFTDPCYLIMLNCFTCHQLCSSFNFTLPPTSTLLILLLKRKLTTDLAL